MTASRRIWVVAKGICIRENRNRYWSTKYKLLNAFFDDDEHLIIFLWNVYKERHLNEFTESLLQNCTECVKK